MNTDVSIPQNFNYIKNMTIFKFGEFFCSWKGVGRVVKLGAAKVIRQHMFFFTLTNFLDNNL